MRNSEWGNVRLKDLLVTHFPGAWGDDPGDNSSHNVSVLRSTNLDDEGRLNLSTGALRRFTALDLARKRCIDGDILLEASGGGPGKPVGRVALFKSEVLRQKYSASNFFRVLRPNTQVVDPGFLFRTLHLLHKRPSIWKFQQQTTGIINLRYADYLEQYVKVPGVVEQQRIVEILDAVDTLISSGYASLAKLRNRSEGLRSWLAESLASRATLQVGAVFQIRAGITLGPGRASMGRACKYLRVANVQRGLIDLADVALLEASRSEQLAYALREGDLLVIEGHANPDEIGRCALVGADAERILYQNHLFRLRPAVVVPTFGELWLNSHIARAYWRSMCATSSGLYTINSKMLAALPFPDIPFEEQADVARQVMSLDAQLEMERISLTRLELVKEGLMEDLLTGRVRV